MLKYDTRALLEEKFTYYELVIAVAKRARAIADQAELEHKVLDLKPVRIAIDELQKSRAHIQHIETPLEESVALTETSVPASFTGLGSVVGFTADEDDEDDEDDERDEDFDDEDEESDDEDEESDDAEA